MLSIDAQTVATAFAGAGLFFAGVSTWLQYRESLKSRRLLQYQVVNDLTDRVWGLVPQVSKVLTLPDDIDPAERSALVGFYLVYTQARDAARLGFYSDQEWNGLREEFAYWAAQPKAIETLSVLRRTGKGWPPGFFDFVEEEVARYRGSI